jgi:hypothetical protein
MKVEITKRQLEAIPEVCTTIYSTIGCSDTETSDDIHNFDTVIKRELKIIKTFFNKNGYELDVS